MLPALEMVVISPGWPNSALLFTPSTRISAIDSAEGKASFWALLLVWFCAEMPSTVTSVCEGKPPCNEKRRLGAGCVLGAGGEAAVSACTPGRVCPTFSGEVDPAPR